MRSSTAGMSDGFIDKLAFWRKDEPKLGPTDAVIDPVTESQRLQDQKENGKSASAAPANPAPRGQAG